MAAQTGLALMTRVQGARLVNPQGADLGRIGDVAIAMPSGHVVYAILDYGGVMGLGGRRFAVPWDVLGFNAEHDAFVVDMPEDKLRNAPNFDDEALQDLADPRWAKPLHDYYGSRASWYLRTGGTPAAILTETAAPRS